MNGMVKYDNEQEKEYEFFSVKHSFDIGSSKYRPSICYPIPSSLRTTVSDMVRKGLATVYEKEVRFVNGVAMPMHQEEAVVVQEQVQEHEQQQNERVKRAKKQQEKE